MGGRVRPERARVNSAAPAPARPEGFSAEWATGCRTHPDPANGDHWAGALGRHGESTQSGRPPREIDAERRLGALVVAGWTTSFADGISEITEMWTQKSQPDGGWSGTHDLDPGRLPQPGVGPEGSQTVDDIVPLSSGFLATGDGTSDAKTETPDYFAAVWYSPNGRTWVKLPEARTGFERAFNMWGAAVNGTHIVLAGYRSNPAGEESGLQIWHGCSRLRPSIARHRVSVAKPVRADNLVHVSVGGRRSQACETAGQTACTDAVRACLWCQPFRVTATTDI